MTEHPIQQPIREIAAYIFEDGASYYQVGQAGVTAIEACTKSGMHADIPYVRVWKGDVCEAEFCQHNIVGTYFGPAIDRPIETDALADVCRLAERLDTAGAA